MPLNTLEIKRAVRVHIPLSIRETLSPLQQQKNKTTTFTVKHKLIIKKRREQQRSNEKVVNTFAALSVNTYLHE